MDRKEIFSQIQKKESYLCVGLDTDLNKIPKHLLKEPDPIFAFNRQVIDATADFAIAYKPNLAFYEAQGPKGWESLSKTIEYIPDNIFTIADAKRGDIGNTSKLYAKAFFDSLNFDSITVAPYMGQDSVVPFLDYENKWVILLAHTSNTGSNDFQLLKDDNGTTLYHHVLKKASEWAGPDQLMFVVGATRADKILEIREAVPEYFFLVPGVGAQGGNLKEISEKGFNSQCGLIVNSSRGIIYAGEGKGFHIEVRKAAKELQVEMSKLLNQFLE